MYNQFRNPRIKNYKRKEYNGRIYHSKAEAGYAKHLDSLVESGEILSWQPQYRINLEHEGIHITTMIVDFYVIMPDGSGQLHEVKGFETEYYRLKRKIFEAVWLPKHKDIEYKVIKP